MYEILSKIGEGGMGCVYKAKDPNDSIVALKMMSNRVTCYPEYRALFQSEVDTLRRMNHPSVVKIVGSPYQDSDGNLYLPMEFVKGRTLEQMVAQDGVLSVDEAVILMGKILDAMQYVHDSGSIHRDLKPSNIMVKEDNSICVIDFGIAKDSKVGGSGQTVGRIIGTDGYMSPEQANGLNIDIRTDIYSLGCVLYFLLTGKSAIAIGSNPHQTVMHILNDKPSLPSTMVAGVSPELDKIFEKAVDKNMTKRYGSAKAFKTALEHSLAKGRYEVTIGREDDNDIVIFGGNNDVSRHHLVIKALDQAATDGSTKTVLQVCDLGSTNGTGYDGRLLRLDTISIEYNGTMALPEVLLAGKPEYAVDWQQVMSILRSKGWNSRTSTHEEMPSLGCFLSVVCFISPLIGWILWALYRNEHPKKASRAAHIAWMSFAINVIITLLLGI